MVKNRQKNLKDSSQPVEIFHNHKEMKFMATLAVIAIIVGILLDGKEFIFAYYPYILMVIGVLATTFLKDRNLGVLIFLFTLVIIFPIQIFYYGVVPLHGNYVPITVPYMQQMFQMFGKFHMVYYPDYPQPGDTITAFVDVCDNSLKNCTKLNNYTIIAHFKDDGNVEHNLLNETVNESFSLSYYGKPIYLSFLYSNTPAFNEFIIPKPSFYQSVTEIVPRHPFFLLLGAVSSILGLWVLVEIVKKLKEMITSKLRNNSKSSSKKVTSF